MMENALTVAVIGGGLAGVSCALEVKARLPGCRVRIAEMGDLCLSGMRRMAPISAPASGAPVEVESLLEHVYRGREAARHLFHRFDGEAFWRAMGNWPRTEDGCIDLAGSAEALLAALQEKEVECVPGRKASQVAPRGSDGLFRIWFDVGNPWEAHCLVLAMGGGRHRGLGWVQEWGHELRPGSPAFLALRLTETRWRALSHVRWTDMTVCWLNPENGETITEKGEVVWRYPFLEGSAVAAVTGRAGDALRRAGTAGRLELGLPNLKERGLDTATLQQKVQQGGSRPVSEDPPAEFDPGAWRAIVRGARIRPDEAWSRLSRRQVQTLASHLSRLTVKFSGSRQWREEFSIQGGLDPDQFHAATLESRLVPGLYVLGEMLDIDGAPGGTNLHLAMAGAQAAAAAITDRLMGQAGV